MARKEARSKPNQSASRSHSWKRRWVFIASGLAVIGICVTLKMTVGSKSASAQIPNPFRKGQTTEQQQPQQQQPVQPGVQQATAAMPRAERPSTT